MHDLVLTMLCSSLSRLAAAGLLALVLVVAGCDSGGNDDDTPAEADITITISNVSASAWVVTSVEGASDVAPIDADNPTLTLSHGTRYRIVNNGSLEAHPFAIQNANGDYLLAQGGPGDDSADGPFEDSPDVDFVSDRQGITFTFTADLASAATAYICTIHSNMEGRIRVG